MCPGPIGDVMKSASKHLKHHPRFYMVKREESTPTTPGSFFRFSAAPSGIPGHVGSGVGEVTQR